VVGILLVALAALCWALDTLLRYPLLSKGLSPLDMVLFEHFVLTIIFIPFLLKRFKNVLKLKLETILYFMIVGGFGSALATLAFTKAFTLINPSVVILLQKLQPVVAISLAALFLKESVGGKFIIWAAVSLVGSFLIIYKDLTAIFKIGESFEGVGYTLLAVLFWASATVFGKKLTNSFSSFEMMAGRFFVGLLTLVAILFYLKPTMTLDVSHLPRLFGMIALSGLLGMYLYYVGLQKISARVCALTELFFPFFAVICNWLFLSHKLDFIQLAGGGLLLIGSSMIQLRKY